MLTREFHTSSGSLFGTKLDQQLASKRAVAKKVAEFLWQHTVEPLFINDGSSTSYVWCYYMRVWVKHRSQHILTVWTNNYDLAMQALREPNAPSCVKIKVAPGEFNFQFCATLGDETTAWVAEKCQDKTCLLAVTKLDAKVGPCGRTNDALEIKKTLLERAGRLIIVADAEKLSQPREPFLAASETRWQEWLTQRADRLWVFTDLDPTLASKFPLEVHPSPRTPLQWQENNAHALRNALGNRFVVAQP